MTRIVDRAVSFVPGPMRFAVAKFLRDRLESPPPTFGARLMSRGLVVDAALLADLWLALLEAIADEW